MSTVRSFCFNAVLVAVALLIGTTAVHAQTEFSYQGRLDDQGAPASGNFDFEFDLYSDVSGGTQLAPASLSEDVLVRDGYFVTQIDFGAVFDGSEVWLEVKVRPAASSDPFDILTPRQSITRAPQAMIADRALTASSVDWTDITNIPADIADGDDNTDTNTDTLAALACPDDQIAQTVEGTWKCLDNSDAALLTRVQGIDGSGSGIDADTVDGTQAADLATDSDVTNLQSQIDALQAQLEAVSGQASPHILGASAQTSNGRFSFQNSNGILAANKMCTATYPSNPSAHLCTLGEVQRALADSNYGNGLSANTTTWTIAPITTGQAFTNSNSQNTCHNLMYNSGDYARGTRLTVNLNWESPGNGGGVIGNHIEVQREIACSQNMAVLCCR